MFARFRIKKGNEGTWNLLGTSQHLICGANHNCFFTGLNYMCCPSNEPSIDNQPSCPYPKLTVLDPHGLPMKCSQIARSCPGVTKNPNLRYTLIFHRKTCTAPMSVLATFAVKIHLSKDIIRNYLTQHQHRPVDTVWRQLHLCQRRS